MNDIYIRLAEMYGNETPDEYWFGVWFENNKERLKEAWLDEEIAGEPTSAWLWEQYQNQKTGGRE